MNIIALEYKISNYVAFFVETNSTPFGLKLFFDEVLV